MTLIEAFEALARGHELNREEVPTAVRSQLEAFGVRVNADGIFEFEFHDWLDAATIQDELNSSTLGWLQQLEVVACTESTNSDLLALSRDKEIDGWIRLAEVQTLGRGRRGRRWVSPFAANIALSIGITVKCQAAELGAIGLAVGLHAATEIRALGLRNVRLKWPNDVLLGECKIGGILIELADPTSPATLVIGIGINVFAAPGVDVTGDYLATQIAPYLQSCSRNFVVARLINSTYAAVRLYEEAGFPAFKAGWEKLDALRGQPVALLGVEPSIRGIGIGVDAEGAYLIRTDGGTERVIGGELSVRLGTRERDRHSGS